MPFRKAFSSTTELAARFRSLPLQTALEGAFLDAVAGFPVYLPEPPALQARPRAALMTRVTSIMVHAPS